MICGEELTYIPNPMWMMLGHFRCKNNHTEGFYSVIAREMITVTLMTEGQIARYKGKIKRKIKRKNKSNIKK